MEPHPLANLMFDLLVVLTAGFLAGLFCKRTKTPVLVGYLLVGTIIGDGGLRLVGQHDRELEWLAEAGALFLLFGVGLEFSWDELQRMRRFFLLGGTVQMLLVAAPLTAAARYVGGMPWNAALLAGTAGALSSTVLVFKALADSGQVASAAGRRAIGILLFQDVALVPLMLLVPLLTGQPNQDELIHSLLGLTAKSGVFLGVAWGMHFIVQRGIVAQIARLRSVELVVLFALVTLCGLGWLAYQLGLPPAIGALAAGLALGGNRLTKQIDTIVLPFRDSFAAVFFVTLGMLLRPATFLAEPLLMLAGLACMIVLKSAAGWAALRAVGLPSRAAWGMGLGLSQLGEFSFLLVSLGVAQGMISAADYNRMLFIALGTLVLTPLLLRRGLRLAAPSLTQAGEQRVSPDLHEEQALRAIVIGIGPIGRRIASHLETTGVSTTVVDLSPVNLYPFAQQGFTAIAGDSRDRLVLLNARADHCRVAVVCVPDDDVAEAVVLAIREINSEATVLVRCRYEANLRRLEKAGASVVVSEEAEASGRLLEWCRKALEGPH